jgi:hypothetical protein
VAFASARPQAVSISSFGSCASLLIYSVAPGSGRVAAG